MAKELPYFKFVISEYLNGDIFLEDYKTQGVFINVCAYYWHCSCDLTLSKLKKKYKDIDDEITILVKEKMLKLKGEKLIINFLDEQWNSKEVLKVINRANGLKGGRPKTQTESEEEPKNNPMGFKSDSELKANDNPNITNIDNIKEDKIKEDDVKEAKTTPTHNFFTIHEFEKIEFDDNFSHSTVKHSGFTIEKIKLLFIDFIKDQKGVNKIIWKNESDAKQHFIYWLKKQKPQSTNPIYKHTNNSPLN